MTRSTRFFLSINLAALFGCSSVQSSQVAANAETSLALTSPADGATVSGLIDLAVRADQLPGLAVVEYRLNGRPLPGGRRAARTFNFTWQSATIWNGQQRLQARGYDSAGRLLASSPEISFTVANGTGTVRALSPTPASTLSGTVTWSVRFSDASPVEAIMYFVDGQEIDIHYVGGASGMSSGTSMIKLDTTRFANGEHELFAGVHSRVDPLRSPVAMSQIRVRFENGRVARQLLPRWREMFLTPGETAALNAALLYTTGERTPADEVSYASNRPGVATVDASGTVRALAPGVAILTLSSGSRQATAQVVVNTAHVLPHFSRDGQMLTRYEEGRSLWVRAMFHLDAAEIRNTAGLLAQARAASLNTLMAPLWALPQDLKNPATFEQWRLEWDRWWNHSEAASRQFDMPLLLIGDNLARTAAYLNHTLTSPWGLPGLKHAIGRVRDSRRVVGIDMVDEVSAFWGDTPAPSDGRWLNQTPSIPDNAFRRVMSTINQVPGRPSITWPILWTHGGGVARNWMGDPAFSDYATNYWDNVGWRVAYPWGPSMGQVHSSMRSVTVDRRAVLQRERPELLQMTVCGPYYTKRGPGGQYVPGQDQLQSGGLGLRPEAISAQVLFAAASGAAGMRIYGYDTSYWKLARINGAVGSGNLQTGADPFYAGTSRWHAMSAALNLMGRLEPYLLQPRRHSPDWGPEMVTTVRGGPRSRLLLAVNMSDGMVTTTANLAPYRYAGAANVLRYRLRGGTLSTRLIPATDQETITFSPGEGLVWLFLPPEDTMPRSIVFGSESQTDLAVSGTFTFTPRTDPIPPACVEFYVDGRLTQTRSGAPFTFKWDTSQEKPGIWHGLTLRAYDQQGRENEARMTVFTVRPETTANLEPEPSADNAQLLNSPQELVARCPQAQP